VRFVLLTQLVVAPLVWFVAAQPALLRQLLPAVHAQRAVESRAQCAFLDHQVSRTRERTGVLIFVSELEHEVVMLGDEGIHAVLHQAGWNELVVQVTHAMRTGRGGEGVCEVIRKVGATLAELVPQSAEDVDELDNRVRRASEHASMPRVCRDA
jgi:putative membrane protein